MPKPAAKSPMFAPATLFFFVLGFCPVAYGLNGADNPPTETMGLVKGTLPTEGAGCAGDLVTATDSGGRVYETHPDTACIFTLNLPVGKNYSISFSKNGKPAGALAPGMVLLVPGGIGTLDLGRISCTFTECTPTNELSPE